MDAAQIDEMATLMERHGLTRMRVEEASGGAVEMERPGAGAGLRVPSVPATAPTAAPGVASAPSEDEPLAERGAEPQEPAGEAVTAPMVGVFYAAPAPGAEPFVRVGARVHAGDTLCVIEAMKLMNEVTAQHDGVVCEVCVADGDLVDFGRCLMRIG